MITKFKEIKKLAVFNDFNWDRTVRDRGGNIIPFTKINIIYGRNYSGKTSLSRLVRALEIGSISDKYEGFECVISIEDGEEVTQTDFTLHNKTVRVFNEDFIDHNLRFIANNDDIEPFAILGEGNNEIEQQIQDLKDRLGSNEKDNETGLYQDLKSLSNVQESARRGYDTAKGSLESQLRNKATVGSSSIKYQSEIFGDQNYNISKLKRDISLVLKDEYVSPSQDDVSKYKLVLNENTKSAISNLTSQQFKFSELYNETSEIVARKIGQSNKIEALVKNAILNSWVEQGKELHQEKREVCSFCNNTISENRWAELEMHFDKESDQLKKDINDLISKISLEESSLLTLNIFRREQVYSKYYHEYDELIQVFTSAKESYNKSLNSLKSQLQNRISNILNIQTFEKVQDFTSEIEECMRKFDDLRIKSNEYTSDLSEEQTNAKNYLRYNEVYNFIRSIEYEGLVGNIERLNVAYETSSQNWEVKNDQISSIVSQISSKQRELKDESMGAEKVNDYLNNHFGHDYLSLKAIEFEDSDTGNKRYRFEIYRGNSKAFHLSEGEKRLIAFCYFIAKLEDIETKGKNPIIWVDDPISSLDNNHIFFIYSLLKVHIYDNNDYEQLFISTHNLNFLKYLQRLPRQRDYRDKKVMNFIIERIDKESNIKEMPKYIRKNVTEFNHLFKQIFDCSNLDRVTDDNYSLFYNFGNNARKFMEIYLSYKYPDYSDEIDKLRKFFGSEEIPVVLTNRINNEYSHLAGVFERGQQLLEEPEMKKSAQLIIERIKFKDEEQYDALIKSIE